MPTSRLSCAIRSSNGWEQRSTEWSKEETAVFEAKFALPWSFTEKSSAAKHMPKLHLNMLVTGAYKEPTSRS